MNTEKKGLAGFNFDDDKEWDFDEPTSEAKEKETEDKGVIKKKEESDDDEDEDENFGDFEPAKKEVEKKKVVEKKKTTKIEEEDEDEDEDEDENDESNKKDEVKGKEKAEDKSKEGVEETDEDDYFTDLSIDMKERGIFSTVEISKDKKVTEDEFFANFEAEIEGRLAETFESIIDEVGQEGSDFLQYIKNGGKPEKFLSQISSRFNLDDLDTSNETQVIKTLKHYLTKYENLDEEEVTDKIQWLKDGGKEKVYAEKYFKTIKADDTAAEKQLLDNQKAAVIQAEKSAKEFNSELKDIADKTDSVGSFNINKVEIKGLMDYITKPVVKVGKNSFVPEVTARLNKVLRGKTDKDKKDLLVLSKILKADFKLDDLETTTETKVTKRAKSRLADKRSINRVSSGSSGKSLADMMD